MIHPSLKPTHLIHQPVLEAHLPNVSYVILFLSMDITNTTVIQAANIFHLQQYLLTGLCSPSCPIILLISARVIILDINQIMSLSHITSSNAFPLDLKSTHLSYKALHAVALSTSWILFPIARLPPTHQSPASQGFPFVKHAQLILAPGPSYSLLLLARMFFQMAAWLVPSYLSGLNSNSPHAV